MASLKAVFLSLVIAACGVPHITTLDAMPSSPTPCMLCGM